MQQNFAPRAVSILTPGTGGEYVFDENSLRAIVDRPSIAGKQVAVVSVAGAFRKGKSFLLNFFVHYLQRLTDDTMKSVTRKMPYRRRFSQAEINLILSLLTPYLTYEDTLKCLRLNKFFNRYINNNWGRMNKKEISMQYGQSTNSGNDHIFVQCLVKGSKYDNTWFYIYENTITVTSSNFNSKESIKEFMEKRASLIEDSFDGRNFNTVYSNNNTETGLTNVLDSILLRFALKSFAMYANRYKIQDMNDSCLEILMKALRQHYPPKSGTINVKLGMHVNRPYYLEIMNILNCKSFNIRQSAAHLMSPFEFTSFNTEALPMKVKVVTRAANVVPLIKEWLECRRRVLKMVIKYPRPLGERRLPQEFQALCQTLGVPSLHEEKGKFYSTIAENRAYENDMYLYKSFVMSRSDGKKLKVLLCENCVSDNFPLDFIELSEC